MQFLIALALLVLLVSFFVKGYERRVARFRGPWIVEAQPPARTSGLVHQADGQQRLVGLTKDETREFEHLDRLAPVDACGRPIAWHSELADASTRETRWLELYLRHQHARRETPTGRPSA